MHKTSCNHFGIADKLGQRTGNRPCVVLDYVADSIQQAGFGITLGNQVFILVYGEYDTVDF